MDTRYSLGESLLFIHNRKNILEAMEPHAVAILYANEMVCAHGDDTYPFVQESDFFYLTGITQDRCALILYKGKDDADCQEHLFIDPPQPDQEVWVGKRLSAEDAQRISGISSIQYNPSFYIELQNILCKSSFIYLKNEYDKLFRFSDLVSSLIKNHPFHHCKSLLPLMARARSIKSEIEIKQIKAACRITAEGFKEVLPYIKPGVMEFELEACLAKSFISRRSRGFAYSPIIASGKRACTLHYTHNAHACRAGELVLFDVGAEYAHYRADVTRVFPVSGRFTPRQRAVYDAVLRIMQHAEKELVCGRTLSEYHRRVGVHTENELLSLNLLTKTDIAHQAPDQPAYRRFCMHGISHHLGLDTHDVHPKDGPLQPGMVLTIEPGIYIPEEGIGIRLENDYVLRADGLENLTEEIPIRAEQIESIMQSFA